MGSDDELNQSVTRREEAEKHRAKTATAILKFLSGSSAAIRLEQLITGGKIIRPAYKSAALRRDYIKMADRL